MKLLVIDGNSILNRAYFGIKGLTTKTGLHTNAVYGFLVTLLSQYENTGADAVAVAFDLKHPTFRHKMYDAYKAGRRPPDENFLEQLPYIKEILPLMGIKVLTCEGYEADDILGTLSVSDADMVYLLTGDRDSFQLISDKCHVIYCGSKENKEYDEKLLFEEYGLTPPEMIQLKGLMGDSSDNIPGAKGVGPATATPLVQTYHSIDSIFEHIDEIKPTVAKKLAESRDNVYLSLKLGTICKEAPVSQTAADYVIQGGNEEELRKYLTRLELNRILERLSLKPLAGKIENKKENEALEITVKRASDEEISAFVDGQEKLYISVTGSVPEISSLSVTDGKSVLSFANDNLFSGETADRIISCGKPIITDSSKLIYAYCINRNLEKPEIEFDTSLAAYLVNPGLGEYSTAAVVSAFSQDEHKYAGDTDVSEKDKNPFYLVSHLPGLYGALKERIAADGMEKLLYETEIPLAEVLASMEIYGFAVDKQGITDFGRLLEQSIDETQSRICAAAGHEFNINSPKQLGVVLFEELGIPTKKKTKTGYSTNADVLEELAPEYEIVADILEYRKLAKLRSTYCEGLLKVIGPDGRIHSTFNQTETRTGRISSSEPNLQNIPVRTKLGAEMRKFFIAKDGWSLSDADYSQIELRVLASIAEDRNMIEAFRNGADIHTSTAARVFNMPEEFVTSEMRSRAKAVNFGIVYGIGAYSLSRDIGVSVKEARNYIAEYLRYYSSVDSYMNDTVAEATEKGYVSTLYGRRRYLPELKDKNMIQKKFGERVARNMPIQGTAADIIKFAMINVFNRLKREGLESRLILQIHDELIIETAPGEEDKVASVLKEEMENAADLAVRLPVDVHNGKNWYTAKG